MRPPLRGDSGSTHVLESVIIASIMVSAVAYVATFEAPQAAPTKGRANLEQVAQDALTILYDTPVTGSSFGDNALSVYLAECMQGDCDSLTSKLSNLVPAGAKYAVYVSNGYETFPVYLENLPSGEAVTATHLLEPKWSNTFTSSGITNVNPTSDALLAYALPIFNSNVVTPGGSPLKVLVEGSRGSDGANYTLTGFYTTVAVDAASASQSPAVSFHFLETADNASAPAAVRDVRDITLDPGTGLPTRTPVRFTLQVRETANVAIPAGAELTVHIPRGWTAAADQGWNDEKWLVLTNATDSSGSLVGGAITARLRAPLQGHSVNFTFDAVYLGDVLGYYPIQAVLSKGAASEANLLVRADNANPADEPYAVPGVYMSVPRPMGATATTNWTLVVEVPYRASDDVTLRKDAHDGAILSLTPGEDDPSVTTVRSSVRIDRIRIAEEDGARIFAGAPTKISGSGAWSLDGSTLLWEGSHDTSEGPLALTFQVTASGVGGKPATRPGIVPPISFDGWEGRILPQVAPGFFRGSFLPVTTSYSGYNVTDAAGAGIDHTFRTDTVYRSSLLPGSSSYTINPAAPFQDSVHGSYAAVDARSVPVGGTAVVTADVQSLLFALSQAGQEAGVSVRFYPPWSGDERTPIWEEGNLDQGLLTGDVTQLTLLDLNGDGYLDPVVGTDNGRVFGYNGLNGARIQGNAFLAPLNADAETATSPSITHLTTINLGGVDYLVVGTDKQSGIFVLDRTMTPVWSWTKPATDTIAMDTTVDIDGDGRRDIVVALGNYGVYVLRAPAGSDDLVPYQAPGTQVALADAFYMNVGEASALLGLPKVGPVGTKAGFAATFQSVPGVAGVDEDDIPGSIMNARPVTSLPRAGLRGVDAEGRERWTFFGSPVTSARLYDYDGDATKEIVGGSPAGYVYMMNGKAPTQPLYSSVLFGVETAIDGKAIDGARAAFLTEEGSLVFTSDGWMTLECPYCVDGVQLQMFPDANALAMNGTDSMWVAGNLSRLYRSVTAEMSSGAEAEILGAVEAAAEEDLTSDIPMVYFADVDPINATAVADVLGTPTTLAYSFATHVHNFYDVTFLTGDAAGRGWVVGDACLATCTEALVMRTTDGGQNWVLATRAGGSLVAHDGGVVASTLRRVNFTTHEIGWIAGDAGTLLRTTDGGDHWVGLPLPTTANIRDVSCAPEAPAVCLILTGDRKAYLSTSALDATPVAADWTEVDLGLGAASRDLHSVAFASSEVAYIGATNMVLRTGDGGTQWTTLPMNYLENDARRVSAFADGSGYVFGGSPANTRIFYLADHELRSTAQTLGLTGSLPSGARLRTVALDMEYAYYDDPNNADDSLATFHASPDGGATWIDLEETGQSVATGTSAGETHAYVRSRFEGSFPASATGGDLRIRADFTVAGPSSLYTARVRDLSATVTYDTSGGPGEATTVIDLTKHDQRDAAATTAAWDTRMAEWRSPIIQEYWTKNVSGEVRDVQTGYSKPGTSAHHEIWVGTGGILAGNSPDYVIYAGSDESKYIRSDNRIYLLDGETGNILDRTESFRGNVTHLRLSADNDLDGAPDFLYATIWEPSSVTDPGVHGYLAALDPFTLDVHWMTELGHVQPADLEVVTGESGKSVGVAAMQSYESSASQIEPGKVWALDEDADVLWSVRPHEQGYYLVIKPIPRNWFFGAYIVEVEVSWTEEVSEVVGGVSATRSVFQAARFYDYFLVTPPDALSPPSPVYNVHLVTWYPDWQ